MASRRSTIAFAGVLGVVAISVTAIVAMRAVTDGRVQDRVAQRPTGSEQGPTPPPGKRILAAQEPDPNKPTYPKDDQVSSVAQASQATGINFLMPNDPLANSGNVDYVWVLSSHSIAVDFPSPEVPQQYLRQDYIEVYEGVWPSDQDPLAAYKHDISSDPDPAKSLMYLGETPVLTVEAHSTRDALQANPAFLRFVTQGVEVQISGGESLDSVVRIAKSILSQTGTSPSP